MAKFWVGVASEEHVLLGVRGGFCQLNHGKRAPLFRMRKDDWLIYYSPQKSLSSAEKLQAFTAVGRVRDDSVYQVSLGEDFNPFRRDMDYLKDAKPVFLHEIAGSLLWKEYRSKLRYGFFEIPKELFFTVAIKMGVVPEVLIKEAPN